MSELYSHSRLASFESCPKKFEYRYVLKLPADGESIEGFVGKRVHELLERLYQFAGRGQVPSLRRVLERYRALWDEAWDADRIRIVRSEMSADDYREIGEGCIRSYYRRHYPFDADETLGLEEKVTFSLDAEGRYRIVGIIDRVVRARDGALEIHDYKTGRRIPRQQELDTDRQLALYQIGLGEHHGRDRPYRLVWHYLQASQVRTSTRSPDQLERLRRDTIGLIDRIRAERDFEARPGPLCRWCEYADRCPAGPSADARRERPSETIPPEREGAGATPPDESGFPPDQLSFL